MAITNGRNLAELASLINSDGKISAEAFSAELTASIDPTMYDSASDVPFEDAVKGTQVFVASEGLLIKLTDSDWYSIDGSTGAAAPTATQAQGTVSGYTSGGNGPAADTSNEIDKFPFAADGNATDVGDLTIAKKTIWGQSSALSGYSSGGIDAVSTILNSIDKFPFAADGNATDVGDLTEARWAGAGQSSTISGYSTGGKTSPDPAVARSSTIDKFPFAADANATDVGDLTQGRYLIHAGQSSTISGYSSGGFAPPAVNTIDKFSFAADGNATDVGDLTLASRQGGGQSSSEFGYVSGGSPGGLNTIEKFSFSSDGNATDVGDLTQGRYYMAGQSSANSGYTSGGFAPPHVNTIDKFPFAADANATDVGDLINARRQITGQQV